MANYDVKKLKDVYLVILNCDCGKDLFISRSGDSFFTEHKLTPDNLGGVTVDLICPACKVEYVLIYRKGPHGYCISFTKMPHGNKAEQVSDKQDLYSVVDGLGDDLDQEELDSPPFFDDPVIDDYMNKLFGVTPIDPKKEDEELSAKLDRAIKIAREQMTDNHLKAFVGGSDQSATIIATLAAAVLAKMR